MAKTEKSFEEKLEELEIIIKELEEGKTSLDDAIDKYTTAMNLAKECSTKLDNAEKAVNKILSENNTLEEFKGLEEEKI